MGQVFLESLDGLVDELAVGRGVPSEPVASVAVEAIAVEHRWSVGAVTVLGVVASAWGFLGGFSLGILGDWRQSSGFQGAGNHIGQDFTVLQGEHRH